MSKRKAKHLLGIPVAHLDFRKFGATMDGTSDYTAAVQAGIDSMTAEKTGQEACLTSGGQRPRSEARRRCGSPRESHGTPVVQAAFASRRTARNSTLVTAPRLAFSSRYRRFL